MLGSGIILENIKILFFKIYTNWPNHKGTNSDLKTDTKIAILFISNLIYLGFRVLTTCKKNLVALSQKLWIFLWCLTFASYYPAQKTELWLAKVRHKKKIHNFWDRVTKFFLQVGNTQKPKHTKFGSKLKPFIARKIHFCVRGSIL